MRHLQPQYNLLHLLVSHPFNMILQIFRPTSCEHIGQVQLFAQVSKYNISQYILRGLMLDTCHSCREAHDSAAHKRVQHFFSTRLSVLQLQSYLTMFYQTNDSGEMHLFHGHYASRALSTGVPQISYQVPAISLLQPNVSVCLTDVD